MRTRVLRRRSRLIVFLGALASVPFLGWLELQGIPYLDLQDALSSASHKVTQEFRRVSVSITALSHPDDARSVIMPLQDSNLTLTGADEVFEEAEKIILTSEDEEDLIEALDDGHDYGADDSWKPIIKPNAAEIKTLVDDESTQTKSSFIDVYFYDLVDPLFGLVDNALTQAETGDLKSEVLNVWLKASNGKISFRFHDTKLVLDQNRSLAYLFYIVGHPLLAEPRPNTEAWIQKPFAATVAKLEPILDKLIANKKIRRKVEKALKKSPRHRLSRPDFDRLVPVTLREAFDGIRIDPDFMTQMAWDEFIEHKGDRKQMKRLNMAYRLFYNAAGMPSGLLRSFIEPLKTRPLLFLHYAIGRDAELEPHKANRSVWDWENTLSIFPVPFYHALNGRGSLNWLDVVFRTASCWEEQNRRLVLPGGIDMGPMTCRWGVRKWEKHRYTTTELGRMVAHEIGHCLGLGHVESRCIVYKRIEDANLMQQQRMIGLKQWGKPPNKKCKCLKNTCGECQCTMDDDNFARVGEARYLNGEQIETALYYIRKRDYRETPPANRTTRVGPAMAFVTAKEEGILVKAGNLFILDFDFEASFALVRFHMKINSVRSGVVKTKIIETTENGCSTEDEGAKALPARKILREVSFSSMNLAEHQEWTFNEPVRFAKGTTIGLEFSADVRIHQTQEAKLVNFTVASCQLGDDGIEPVQGIPLINFDLRRRFYKFGNSSTIGTRP